jgi:hypothetical protein
MGQNDVIDVSVQKARRLSFILPCSFTGAAGYIASLMALAYEDANGGDISEISARDVARIAGYGKQDYYQFIRSLVDAGVVSEDEDTDGESVFTIATK